MPIWLEISSRQFVTQSNRVALQIVIVLEKPAAFRKYRATKMSGGRNFDRFIKQSGDSCRGGNIDGDIP